jgi:hypothetical protein
MPALPRAGGCLRTGRQTNADRQTQTERQRDRHTYCTYRDAYTQTHLTEVDDLIREVERDVERVLQIGMPCTQLRDLELQLLHAE